MRNLAYRSGRTTSGINFEMRNDSVDGAVRAGTIGPESRVQGREQAQQLGEHYVDGRPIFVSEGEWQIQRDLVIDQRRQFGNMLRGYRHGDARQLFTAYFAQEIEFVALTKGIVRDELRQQSAFVEG